jgi:hypothetical protein
LKGLSVKGVRNRFWFASFAPPLLFECEETISGVLLNDSAAVFLRPKLVCWESIIGCKSVLGGGDLNLVLAVETLIRGWNGGTSLSRDLIEVALGVAASAEASKSSSSGSTECVHGSSTRRSVDVLSLFLSTRYTTL